MKKATWAALAAAAIAGASTAQAAVYYWDADGDSSAATGGTGTWGDTSTAWRSGSSTGSLSAWAWVASTDANFGGTAGIVTLKANAHTTVNAMTFETSGYTISGSGGSETLRFNALPIINVADGVVAVINANTSGTSLNKQGAGTLILNGASAVSSKTILTAGTLAIGNNAAVGTGTLALAGGTLRIDGQGRTLGNTFAIEAANATVTVAGSYGLSVAGFTNTQSGQWVVNVPTLTLGASSGVLANAGATKTLTLSGSGNIVANGVISNGTNIGNLTYAGTGTLSLNMGNTYSGGTVVNNVNARVNVNGTTSGQGDYTVTAGTLGGSGGSIGLGTDKKLLVASGARLAPGLATGTTGILSVTGTQTTAAVGTSTVNLAAGSNFDVDASGAVEGSGYDQLNVTGTVSLNGANLNFVLNPSFTLTGNENFLVIKNDGSEAILGNFAGLAQGAQVATANGYALTISYTGGDGNDVAIAVPEPSSMLGLLCLGGLTARRRRRH